ncbi:MAG: hypothetical protein M1834_006406 [Cirrosporium novae-zelandiae]|nr:MAG: hypothetical protein M1834_006406 [Cirrosporium novae-zelandiae]
MSTSPPPSSSSIANNYPPKSKPFSLSLGSSKAKPTRISLGVPFNPPRKRPHASLEADDEADVDDSHQGKEQLVTSFDDRRGGAIGLDNNDGNEKSLLVIPKVQGRDWRNVGGAKRRGKNLLPEEVRAMRSGEGKEIISEAEEKERVQKMQYGLVVTEKQRSKSTDGGNETTEMDVDSAPANRQDAHHEPEEKITEDERAIQALMGNTSTTDSSRIISHQDQEPHNDLRSYRSDISTRPESATLADYNDVPVEEFGAALLRGMGWKDGQEFGGKRRYGEDNDDLNDQKKKGTNKKNNSSGSLRLLEKRPALLGIGAKEMPEGLEEPGAWGKGAKLSSSAKDKGRRRKKIDAVYNPVMMRNTKTGEMVTEEELRKRKEESLLLPVREAAEQKKEKPPNRARSSGHKEPRREEEEERRRSRSPDSKRARRRRDEDSEEDYYRERERRRRRRREDEYFNQNKDGGAASSSSLKRREREGDRDRDRYDEGRHRHSTQRIIG